MINDDLKEVFQDTKRILEQFPPIGKTVLHTYNHLPFSYIGEDKPNYTITVKPVDTISCVLDLEGKGSTAMLNMASNRRAGGGVENGARAQEECLFRCTDLYKTVIQDFYPLELDNGLYTTNTMIIKDADYNHLMKPVIVDTITVPAVNLNKYDLSESEYQEIVEKKIDFILNMASAYRVDNVVVGAWGCGVYKNDPKFIAETFKKVLDNGKYGFKNVIFGVINDKNSVDNNYEIFKNTLI